MSDSLMLMIESEYKLPEYSALSPISSSRLKTKILTAYS